MLKIQDVDYLGELKLRLTFSNGDVKIFNGNDLSGSVYDNIKNENSFIHFGLEHGTIVWENDIDASPEYLYDISKEEN